MDEDSTDVSTDDETRRRRMTEIEAKRGGHWGTVNTATPQKKITNTASPQKKLTKHRHRNLIFVLRFK